MSFKKKIIPTSERNEKLACSTSERNEKLASMHSLLEKELELEESLLNEELSGDGVKNIRESEPTESTEKNVKNANDHKPEELEDDFNLRWDEDDEEPKNQVNILDEILSSIGGESNVDASKIDLKSTEDVIKAIEDEEKLLDDFESENKLVQSPKSTCSQHIFKSGLGLDKPDIMLEIPSQELIECSDDEDGSIHNIKVLPGTVKLDLNNDSLAEDKLLASDEEISPENPALDIENDRTNLQVEDENVMKENSPKATTLIDEAKLAADILTKQLSSMVTEAHTGLSDQYLAVDDSYVYIDAERLSNINELSFVQNYKGQKEDSVDIELKEQIENITDKRNIDGAMDVSGDRLSLSDDLKVTNSNIIDKTTELTESKEKTHVEMIEPLKVPEVLLVSCSIASEKSIIEPIATECDTKEANVNSEENILLESGENMDVLKDIQKHSTENESNETEEQVSKDVLDYNILDVNAEKNLEKESTESQSVESDLPSIKVIDPQPADMETSVLSPVMKKKSPEELNSQPSTPLDISNQDPEPSTSSNQKNENTLFGLSAENIDVPEMTDSLGLLAESCHVMEEDEEQDEDDEDDDEFDYFQDDESSNQVTAEHSEDSNAHHSEMDAPKFNNEDELDDITLDTDQKPKLECNEFYTEDKIQVISKCEGKDSNQNEPANQELTDKEKDWKTPKESLLKNLLMQIDDSQEPEKQSPPKIRKLEITKVTTNVFNIVDLEESSEEDDKTNMDSTVRENFERDQNMDDSKFKSMVEPTKPPIGLEVFNLDSDDEEATKKIKDEVNDNIIVNEQGQKKEKQLKVKTMKCINKLCTKMSEEFYIANMQAIKFYEVDRIKRCYVCPACYAAVEDRNLELIDGIQNFKPLLEIRSQNNKDELVEISDSESDEEEEFYNPDDQLIGEDADKIEEQLTDMFNEVWDKYKMDVRLEEAQDSFIKEVERLKNESKELNDLMNDCQATTDDLRNEIYETFRPRIVELTPLEIYDTPTCSYTSSCPRNNKREIRPKETSVRHKRSLSPAVEIPAKRPAIPLGYTPLDNKNAQETDKMDDDLQEVSVVKLSAESAPPDLPPPGDLDLTLAPLKLGMSVFAMRNSYGSWLPAKIVELTAKSATNPFTMCCVKFEEGTSKQPFKSVQARFVAYAEPPEVRMTIGRRVIALFKDAGKKGTYYSGIVAEIPNPVNNYRYLVFFDDGYAQYAPHSETRLVCECSPLVWEEVHLCSRDFVRQYLQSYPERPMVRLHAGQNLKTEWRGKWWSSRVMQVDASLVEVQFLKIARREWIYRGSTRLAPLFLELKAAERHRPRAMPRTQVQARNMPYVEYIRSNEQNRMIEAERLLLRQLQEEIRRQAVAKKSTTTMQPPSKPLNSNLENICSRVVYYTPKNAVKPYKMVPHVCSPQCKRTDVLALKDLRTYNPLAKPLLSGWERLIVRWKGHRDVIYRAPCGRRLRDMRELHKYLRDVESDMAVDLFDFSPNTHCLAEFVLNNCNVGKKDLSHGKENVPVPCVNYYDETLPDFCIYNAERTPTAGVPLNLDPEFLCGCDCEDDCEDKTKCACWKMTLEGARTIGLEGDNVGYVYKRLPEPLPSGIYECNSRCKCKHTCLNRVAQHPLQLKLQVFKTANRGWGIRALNDVPKGAFLCVYAGNLLTDATANTDGLTEGDEYLAELDYIEVVEQMKEGYEEDIPEETKKLDNEESALQSEQSEDESSEEESNHSRNEQEDDDDFKPGYISESVTEFNKRLRRRNARKDKEENEKEKEKESQKENEANKEKDSEKDSQKDKDGEKKIDVKNPDEDCITISDDEEVREPSCFTAAAGMDGKEFVSKYRSVRTLFGEDEACYIMDAKVQGNIGRYLNHSCSPNVFVQNVFVDTHDPRFPWVAFFALSHIRSGTELTWNYNYDIGSVPGKVMYCHCGSANCRGRLL